MPRYKLLVAYDGTNFHGWQKQHPPDGEPLRTVQGVVEEAVRDVVREPVNLLGASRTDSGVHARGQVAAFTTSGSSVPRSRMARAINARLPDDVQIVKALAVAETFNPISDALTKGYRYRIAHGSELPPLFDRHYTANIHETLDVRRMQAAAAHFQGEHDFASLTRMHHNRESTVRTITACSVTASSRTRLRIDVAGNGFLWNMVRILAGTLVQVGRGRIEPEAIAGILDARDRTAAGPTMPPEGLCLMWIRYKDARGGGGS